jgi:hypothetical protein
LSIYIFHYSGSGKQSCEKLLAFYYGLRLANLELLAESARNALNHYAIDWTPTIPISLIEGKEEDEEST